MLNLSGLRWDYVNFIALRKYNFLDSFFLFCVQNLRCNDSKYHSFNWKDVSVTNVDFFEKKQFRLQFSMACYRFTWCTEFLLWVSVCTKGFAYLLCLPREKGIGLVCTRGFSFHEFYNFKPNFYYFFFFWTTFFLPTTFTHTHTHDFYPLPTTHDI